jgi:hypothetical protein
MALTSARALKLRVSSESMPVPEAQPAMERLPMTSGMALAWKGLSGTPTMMSLPSRRRRKPGRHGQILKAFC